MPLSPGSSRAPDLQSLHRVAAGLVCCLVTRLGVQGWQCSAASRGEEGDEGQGNGRAPTHNHAAVTAANRMRDCTFAPYRCMQAYV